MKKIALDWLTLACVLAILCIPDMQPACGSVVDSDGDGLPDALELALGTDIANPDSDADGIIDGGDPDTLTLLIGTFDDRVFKNGEPGLRVASASRLNDIEAMFLDGDIASGIAALKNLLKRFDGCPSRPDPNDWIINCTAQIQVQEMIDTLIANHFSYGIDPAVLPAVTEIPGLSGGPPRTVAVAVGPDGVAEPFVTNEVILQVSDSERDVLAGFLDAYGATILRDGTPLLAEGEAADPDLPAKTGFYLVRVDPARSTLADFSVTMEAAGLRGSWVFSSEAAARVASLVAREKTVRQISLNQIADFDTCTVCEHPDGAGDYLDAATWWWMTEDLDPTTPHIDGISVGVVRAWDYLRYQGYPPTTSYYPTKVAIVDGGFDLDTTTGVPLVGGGDFLYSGSKPPQIDEIDYDWTSGGIALGFSNCPDGCWHGQLSFGVCCANGRNLYGTAGTSGGGTTGAEIDTLLIRVGPDVYQIASGIYDAFYNNADVINSNITFACGWMCRNFDNGNVLKAAVGSARNRGSIVVTSSGNQGKNIDESHQYPCELDGAICVGAIIKDGNAWAGLEEGSNYGTVVDMWAPTGLRSSVTRDTEGQSGIDHLALFNGTSCSSPYLAGIVALMKALDPFLYKSQVLEKLQATVNTSADPKVTPGYVDALRAVQAVRPNRAPSIQIASPANGDLIPYAGGYLDAEVTDPEKTGPWGNEFEVAVLFSSDRQGILCSDSGVIPPYACLAPALMLGAHTITATGIDAFGATETDQVTIYVVNRAPTANITYPSSGSTYYTSQTISFSGFGFDPDEEIETGDMVWHSDISGFLGTGTQLSVQLGPGTHTITLTVTDAKGETDTDAVVVTVSAGDGYPSAKITSPANGTIVRFGDQVTIMGMGTDPEDGTLLGSNLVWNSDVMGYLGTGNTITITLSGSRCNTWEHIITLTVTDSDGRTATHSIQITVVELC